jgi:hypothetical protein
MQLRTMLATMLCFAGSASGAFAQSHPLNDTGSLVCRDKQNHYSHQCAGTGQDGAYGRDVTADQDKDGLAGFSFQKISATGAKLPLNATAWSCVLDKVTGLMWENKTNDGGLHDANNKFFNLQEDIQGDVGNWVNQVNAQGLCGYNDWRLPDVVEQQSIYDYNLGGAESAIDTRFFQFPVDEAYWSGQRYVKKPSTEIFGIYATEALINIYANGDQIGARLVRTATLPAGAPDSPRYVLNGDEVTDTYTGLVWRRCAEGQKWTGSTCTGNLLHPASNYNFQEALTRASSQAALTGEAWRVPNIKELMTTANYAFSGPALDPAIFPNNMAGFYMSSTPPVENPTNNWMMDASAGFNGFYDPSLKGALRLVRDAP